MWNIVRILLLQFFSFVLPAAMVAAGQEQAEKGATASRNAAPAGHDSEALRKAAQNPVASLISVPLQENWNFNVGPNERTQNIMNIQPVVPTGIGKNWNLIVRWVTPVIWQPIPTTTQQGFYGLGDMNPSFFFSPKRSKVIWGAGPTVILPTATNTAYIGQGKFSMGPTAVLVVQPEKWTVGVLINNVWSVAGHEDKPDVNQMTLQHFITYNMKNGWYLTWQPTLTANWEAGEGGRWVVPFGGGVGRIMRLGMQPVNVGFQFFGNAVHPENASRWGFRAQIAFLFPRMPKK